jgi:hypothetical protein
VSVEPNSDKDPSDGKHLWAPRRIFDHRGPDRFCGHLDPSFPGRGTGYTGVEFIYLCFGDRPVNFIAKTHTSPQATAVCSDDIRLSSNSSCKSCQNNKVTWPLSGGFLRRPVLLAVVDYITGFILTLCRQSYKKKCCIAKISSEIICYK